MASSSDVIFPESMVDFLANPVDIRFGSMLAESITPAACLIIEGNAVTSTSRPEPIYWRKSTHPLLAT
jgi:hypothetical protein